MAVQIEPGRSGVILVNKKPVEQDMDGTWRANKDTLTETEKKYFWEYIGILETTSAKEVVATFKG
jgi:hypothetical protein